MKLASCQRLRVPNFSAHTMRSVLEDEGLDWKSALIRAELDATAVDRPGGMIPAQKELTFQLEFIKLTRGRVDLWVRAARAYTIGAFGVHGLAFASAPTLEAWAKVASDTDHVFSLVEYTPMHTEDGRLTGVETTYDDAPDELATFSMYRDLCATARALTWLYGEPFPFSRIDFPLEEADVEIDAFVDRNVIRTGADRLRLWWDPAISSNPLPYGDEFQHQTWAQADNQALEVLRTTGDWPRTVAQAVRQAPTANRLLSNVAAHLRVSTRTLQRRLEDAGVTFAEVRDDALVTLASDLLMRTDQSIAQISRRLGYSEPASFTMAFKRWSGVPPTAFRLAASYEKPDS